MLTKALLLVIAMSVALLLVAATTVEEKEQDVEKRATRPTTLADVVTILRSIQKRVSALESSRTILLRGRDGRDGLTGKPGSRGLKGAPGNSGMRGPPGPKGGGVQYVRWGRTTCPADASLVYKGRIGGEAYYHPGGGANYVCLPEIPKYGRYRPGHQSAGEMYGTEYEVNIFNPFTRSNLHDHDAPCAVCYVTTRSAKMMIPATYVCPAGWTREYRGYLMTAYYSHKHSSDFICVDQYPEVVPGSQSDRNGARLYPVEGVCGSLPCLPYVNGRELTCAVCTK